MEWRGVGGAGAGENASVKKRVKKRHTSTSTIKCLERNFYKCWEKNRWHEIFTSVESQMLTVGVNHAVKKHTRPCARSYPWHEIFTSVESQTLTVGVSHVVKKTPVHVDDHMPGTKFLQVLGKKIAGTKFLQVLKVKRLQSGSVMRESKCLYSRSYY